MVAKIWPRKDLVNFNCSVMLVVMYKVKCLVFRWLKTIHIWLHHKKSNYWTTTNKVLKVGSINKAFLDLSSPANWSALSCTKHKLEI